MHDLLLAAQTWWDAQRFDQPEWQVAAWRDQKVRHIHLHVTKALGKVVAMLDEAGPLASDSACVVRVRCEVLPDVAIYRSQLINLLRARWALPSSLSHADPDVGAQADDTLWRVTLGLSRASAALATYLEPREHGASSCASHLIRAIEQLHACATTLAAWFRDYLAHLHLARLEALLGASIPALSTDQGDADR